MNEYFYERVFNNKKRNNNRRKGYLKPDQVSIPLKVINAISDTSLSTFGYTPIQVNKKKIIKMAEEVAAITDEKIFGNQDEFLKSVSLFVNGLKQEQFSASGTILLNGFLQNTLRTRKRVVDYINSHPEVLLNVCFFFKFFFNFSALSNIEQSLILIIFPNKRQSLKSLLLYRDCLEQEAPCCII